MRIIESNLLIPNKNLDMVKEKLRNLGNRYIENDSKILNISRHKLARAGNAAIALKACKLNPVFNDNYDITGFTCDYEKPLNYVLIFNEIASAVDKYGYVVVQDDESNDKYIHLFMSEYLQTLQYSEANINSVRSFKIDYKPITYCNECLNLIDGICSKYNEEREQNDYCSRGTK